LAALSGSPRIPCPPFCRSLEGKEGLIVRRVDLEDLLVRRGALVLLADLVLPDRRDLEVLADALLRVLVGLGAGQLRGDHLDPALDRQGTRPHSRQQILPYG